MGKEAYKRRRVDSVTVGADVFHVRPLTGAQLSAFLTTDGDNDLDGVESIARVCCYCACEPNGDRLWSDDDLAEVSDVELPILRAVAEKAIELSGLADEGPVKND